MKTLEKGIFSFCLLQSLEALDQWLAKIRTAKKVAICSKTDSLERVTAPLVGVSLAVAPGDACYIPLSQQPQQPSPTRESPLQIPMAEALEMLRDSVLENRSVLKVGHNIKFDLHVFHKAGCQALGRPIVVAPIDDTMVLSYVLEGSGTSHSLEELARKYIGVMLPSHKAICGSGKRQIPFNRVPLDKASAYAAEGAALAHSLHILFRNRLLTEKMVTVHENMDRPLVPILGEMERAGILVDAKALQRLSVDFSLRMQSLETDIYHLAGQRFNVSSPRQLGTILFEHLGLPRKKKSSKKNSMYGTDATVLDILAAQGHPLPRLVRNWRQLAKLRSTYIEAILVRRNTETGRVHTSFMQTATATGRLSSTDPNLQNIPARTADGLRIRHAFIAPPGHVLLSADYSQIELRLLAHVADVRALKEAFSHNADVHTFTASMIFNIPVNDVHPLLRRQAKTINFGIIYGISPFGLATQLRLPQEKTRQFIKAYFERYPEIHSYMERIKQQARKQGFVTTLLGRKCLAFGINDRNAHNRGVAERAAMNAPIQGGAADIIKHAMVRLPGALAAASLKARMLLQVHDELVFEVPLAEVGPTVTLIRSVMEGAVPLSVPLVVDIGTGCSWASLHLH